MMVNSKVAAFIVSKIDGDSGWSVFGEIAFLVAALCVVDSLELVCDDS